MLLPLRISHSLLSGLPHRQASGRPNIVGFVWICFSVRSFATLANLFEALPGCLDICGQSAGRFSRALLILCPQRPSRVSFPPETDPVLLSHGFSLATSRPGSTACGPGHLHLSVTLRYFLYAEILATVDHLPSLDLHPFVALQFLEEAS